MGYLRRCFGNCPMPVNGFVRFASLWAAIIAMYVVAVYREARKSLLLFNTEPSCLIQTSQIPIRRQMLL